jgi:hypothetical protein
MESASGHKAPPLYKQARKSLSTARCPLFTQVLHLQEYTPKFLGFEDHAAMGSAKRLELGRVNTN